jgi:hypothetical protein
MVEVDVPCDDKAKSMDKLNVPMDNKNESDSSEEEEEEGG